METMCGNSVWRQCGETVYGDSVWRQCLETVFGDSVWRQCMKTADGDSVWTQYVETVCEDRVWRQCVETVPKTKLNIGKHGFFVFVPTIWNQLLITIKLQSHLKKIKTYLFEIAFLPYIFGRKKHV